MNGRRAFCALPTLPAIPVIDIATNPILFYAVALLDLAFELIALSGDAIKIIISEFAPLFFDLTLDLLPVSFGSCP